MEVRLADDLPPRTWSVVRRGGALATSVVEVAFHKAPLSRRGPDPGSAYVRLLRLSRGLLRRVPRARCQGSEGVSQARADSAVLSDFQGAREQAPLRRFERDRVSQCSPAFGYLHRLLSTCAGLFIRGGEKSIGSRSRRDEPNWLDRTALPAFNAPATPRQPEAQPRRR